MRLSPLWLIALCMAWTASTAAAQYAQGHPEEARNMRLIGWHDLQGRSAYQPIIQQQGERFIAYVGTHLGRSLNPLSGLMEGNGTLVLDVSDAQSPRTLAHIPGLREDPSQPSRAQMVRTCVVGSETYLLRSADGQRHELWNVTEPDHPRYVVTVVEGLTDIHKSWWECSTGVAYLVAGDRRWRTPRMTKVFDLSDPQHPVFIRDFGLAGQQPGSSEDAIPPPLHGPISEEGRVYLAYGTGTNGVIQILDRTRLLEGPSEPTVENLNYPEIGRLRMPSFWGGHTALPLLGIEVTDFSKSLGGSRRDFLAVASESTEENCQERPQAVFLLDITDPSRPFPVSTFLVPETQGGYCARGGRFGPHALNENLSPQFGKQVLFVSYFNAGVRAVDMRNPFALREVGFYIPATTRDTIPVCAGWSIPTLRRMVEGESRCRTVIQTNNVEVDDRGLIFITDRAGTGLHILELSPSALEPID